MITQTYTKQISRFADGTGKAFKVVAIFNPNEETDPWVKYINEHTGQEYSCRKEAFLARFAPIAE